MQQGAGSRLIVCKPRSFWQRPYFDAYAAWTILRDGRPAQGGPLSPVLLWRSSFRQAQLL
ncbi:hypothetical protein SBA6_40067 [Candidatus Sulfopaludibacter sp. SbA6]|nr:hypothetical protein SBA6_40067 [Candidatus Sulfopaludibacter sp. SbA6]